MKIAEQDNKARVTLPAIPEKTILKKKKDVEIKSIEKQREKNWRAKSRADQWAVIYGTKIDVKKKLKNCNRKAECSGFCMHLKFSSPLCRRKQIN